MNRNQFFFVFGKHFTPIERKYFDECWNTLEKHQETTHKKDFPYSMNAPEEIKRLWIKMWNDALYIHRTRFEKKGGK